MTEKNEGYSLEDLVGDGKRKSTARMAIDLVRSLRNAFGEPPEPAEKVRQTLRELKQRARPSLGTSAVELSNLDDEAEPHGKDKE